jgi:hypothetical protein
MATFELYHQSGVLTRLTITEDMNGTDIDRYIANTLHGIERALALGLLVEKPVPGEGEKVERICGYVVGEYEDSKSASFKPCVWLFPDDARTFQVCTVYPENFSLLPFTVGIPDWPAGAPDADTARKKGKLHAWQAEVILAPKTRHDGTPVLSEKGNPVYRFVGVKGAQPVAMETVQTATHRTAPVETPPVVTRTTAMNVTSERCPECNAPAGKLHANKCSLRTITQ